MLVRECFNQFGSVSAVIKHTCHQNFCDIAHMCNQLMMKDDVGPGDVHSVTATISALTCYFLTLYCKGIGARPHGPSSDSSDPNSRSPSPALTNTALSKCKSDSPEALEALLEDVFANSPEELRSFVMGHVVPADEACA